MNNSDILKLFADANRKCGYEDYAKLLDNPAAVYEATEILREERKRDNDKPRK